MSGGEWTAMQKLVKQIYSRSDAEPFREPVDWKSLALFDYPQIIKKPMDLSTVQKNMESNRYKNIHACANDIRLIWKNCQEYNADGSDFYLLAETLSQAFEGKFKKLCDEYEGSDNAKKSSSSSSSAAGANVNKKEPTLDEKKTFAKNLYKITKEELGQLITSLDEKSPNALERNAGEDEVTINVDNIQPQVFHELCAFIKSCEQDKQGRKKKSNKKR
eukprot:CAMPEP_0178970812 /NCGR_PEP_ID=MMETSP0789-20121207/19825_1 /TAXON_ID=3005 /ORGANISM="Rhizosolenia setigera, Strain CCMP 1694" /LENGTH=217 /DNA_ID=CAMNT_0020657509 /DNA_START=177 /DNA_END=830 /DNA_ORIENTATION=-